MTCIDVGQQKSIMKTNTDKERLKDLLVPKTCENCKHGKFQIFTDLINSPVEINYCNKTNT